jgi:hypothetical protein
VEKQQDANYHPMTASPSSRPATTTNTAAMEEHNRESMARTTPPSPPTPLFSLHEYFEPVFDELDKLNKMLDSFIEEENDKARERKRRNDHHHQMLLLARDGGHQ